MANEPVDTHKLNHLTMWIENDGDLYRQQYMPIVKNLMAKRARGVYDAEKAVKLWMYLMESGAKKLGKEFPEDYPRPWHVEFNMATRRAAAKEFNEQFIEEAATGEWDKLLPKKYQGGGAPGHRAAVTRPVKASGGVWKPDTIGDYWYIVNLNTGAKVKIGRISGRGFNAYDRACEEAKRRNGGVDYAWQMLGRGWDPKQTAQGVAPEHLAKLAADLKKALKK